MEQKGYSASRVARYRTEKSSYGGARREWLQRTTSRGQGAAAASVSEYSCCKRACNGTVPGGRTLRAGPLKDVRRMEWRRWCAVVRRQWCEARRCDMAPTRAGASSKLLMAAFQLRLAANPRMFNTHRSTTWPPESAKDEH